MLRPKLERLATYLADLRRHRARRQSDIQEDLYGVERRLELLVQVAVDILGDLLAEKSITVWSYRRAFELGGREGFLPTDLAHRLAEVARLNNVLIHLYEDIDYQVMADSVERALADFDEFWRAMTRLQRERERDGRAGSYG